MKTNSFLITNSTLTPQGIDELAYHEYKAYVDNIVDNLKQAAEARR
jgi:hypothetical protein